ncbi:MAG: oligosaccharide flippase family protein [candidate division Zixibacteria bacterium]|nr:oligosaccharide flippase family protein [candidate division Zixibacteria bacterium]
MTDSDDWLSRAQHSLNGLRGTGVRRLTENFVSLSVLQAANYILPLVTVPYLTRVLGVEKYGLVAFAQAVIQYFIILTTFGFELSATREIAAHREDKERVSRVFVGVLLAQSVFLGLGFLLLYLLTLVVPRLAEDPGIYLITFTIVLGRVLFPVWFFQGMERMKYSTALNLGARVLFVILIFVFVRTAHDYRLVPLFNGLGMTLAGVAGLTLAFTRFSIRFHLPSISEVRHLVRDGFQFFVASLSSSVSASFNTLVLGFATTNTAVGYYAAAEKLYIAMRALFHPVVTALYPYMSSQRNVRLFRHVFRVGLAFAIVISSVAYLFNEEVTRLVFGPGFGQSADLFRIFCLIVPIQTTSMMLGYPFLAALGHASYANYSQVVGSIVHIVLVGMLLTYLTPARITFLLLFTETLILGIKIYGTHKYHLWKQA